MTGITVRLPDEFYAPGTTLTNPARKGLDGRDHNSHSGRPHFVIWDGEGITYPEDVQQSYVLFGASTGERIKDRSLTTEQCLSLIIAVEREYPGATHVGFGFKYDAEMILADLPDNSWRYLMRHGFTRWRGYRITYHPGKRFTVSKTIDAQRYTATIYDVWGFFQSSFIVACHKWLSDDDDTLRVVTEGKARRGAFTVDELETYVLPYWQAEMDLAKRLVNALYDSLLSADLVPSEWHGPGAIAKLIYTRNHVRESMSRTPRDVKDDRDAKLAVLPEEVNYASRVAYLGGHFECYQVGHHHSAVWQYDINSAYPHAISKVPDLACGEWEWVPRPTFDPTVYALWRITYNAFDPRLITRAFPVPYRDERGCVGFPMTVDTWVWTPEAELIADHPQYATIHEAWIWRPATNIRPFAFVPEMYAERKRRKAAGDASEKAMKLALNSLYGKMAQRAGWQDSRPLPRYHQLEWAGYVTSYTRAMLYRAIQQAGDNTIAVETDAIFSTVPLDLPCSDALGDWEMTEHKWITYLASGMYWTDTKAAYRGLDPESLTHDTAIRWLKRSRDHRWREPLVGSTTRFIGAGTGLGTPLHRSWQTDPARRIWVGWMGKRFHSADPCKLCRDGATGADTLHRTAVGMRGGESHPHALPWRTPLTVDDAFAWDTERYDSVYDAA